MGVNLPLSTSFSSLFVKGNKRIGRLIFLMDLKLSRIVLQHMHSQKKIKRSGTRSHHKIYIKYAKNETKTKHNKVINMHLNLNTLLFLSSFKEFEDHRRDNRKGSREMIPRGSHQYTMSQNSIITH